MADRRASKLPFSTPRPDGGLCGDVREKGSSERFEELQVGVADPSVGIARRYDLRSFGGRWLGAARFLFPNSDRPAQLFSAFKILNAILLEQSLFASDVHS